MNPLSVVVLSPDIPYPPRWGFGMRVYHLTRQLAQKHRVTLLCYGVEEEARAAIEHLSDYCEGVIVVPPPAPRKRVAQARSVVARTPYLHTSMLSPAMQAAITRLHDSGRYDVLQVESSPMSGFELGSRWKRVLDEHNIEHELARRVGLAERSPLRRVFNLEEAARYRRIEEAAWRKFDAVLVTSAREVPMVAAAAPKTPVHVVPNGVDLDYFNPVHGQAETRELVITGAMHYRPNADAAERLARDVMPLVVRHEPFARAVIVGGSAPSSVTRHAGPHVTITGSVPDVRPHIARAAAFVVPLRTGGGTRLKVVEAMAMGKAVVSSRIGCEGIDVVDGRQIMLAESAADFAGAAVNLLRHPELRRQLGDEGRRLVEQGHSWAVAGRRLHELYDGFSATNICRNVA